MDQPSRRMTLLCLLCLLCTIASAQEMMTVPLTAFNAGELSPKMEGRIDYPKYTQGLRTCENLLPLTQGPVIRRPGTKYVATTKNSGAVRLVPFEYSVSDTYMLEFGDEYMRVYRNQAQVLDVNDDPYEIETPFDANELENLQFVQTANTMYLVDGNDPPQKLTRDGHDDWTIADVDFFTGPFLPRIRENTTTLQATWADDTAIDIQFNDPNLLDSGCIVNCYRDMWLAQTFTTTDAASIQGVNLLLYRDRYQPYDPLYVSLRAADANGPIGSDLMVAKTLASDITTSPQGEWVSVEFEYPYVLSPASQYAIVIRLSNTVAHLAIYNFFGKLFWAGSYSDAFSGGEGWISSTAGTAWDHLDSGGVDLAFSLIGEFEGQRFAGRGVSLVSDDALFDADHIDSIWKLYHPREVSSVTGTLDANEAGEVIPIAGGYTVTTNGTWTGLVTLQRSYDGGVTWNTISSVASSDNDNMSYHGSELTPNALFRLEMTSYTSGEATYTITAKDYLDHGVVKITNVTDPCSATGIILDNPVSDAPTAIWQEGYWSGYRGWPRTIAFHEQRLWFGGSTDYPQTIWATQTAEQEGDYEDMTVVGTNDDSALIYTLPGKNPIQWLHSQSYLMVGTAGGVGRLGSLNEGMTPTNIEYRLQTTNAAAGIQPVGIGDVLLYVERGGRKVRQYLYQYDVDQFIAPDVSILAEHITEGGLTGMALQQSPQPIVWCPRADGEAVTMTYLRDEEVIAWGRQITDGTIESIAALPGSNEDEVWWSVARTIDGNTVRYIEVLQPHDWGTDQNDCWFVDSGLSFDGGPAVPISNVNQTNPALVTVVSWPTDGDGIALADGDQVTFASVGGMTELNGNVYTIDDANSTDLTFTLNDSDDINDVNAVDFTAYTSGGTVQRVENTFVNLSHLEGETLAVWGDGTALDQVNVDANTITLDDWYNRLIAGLPYTSTLETMPLIVPGDNGPMLHNLKRVTKIWVDFYESIGATAGASEATLQDVDRGTTSTTLYTDWKEISDVAVGYFRKPTVWIRQEDPAPMTVRQIEATLRVGQ